MRRLVAEVVRQEIAAERDRAQQRIDEIMAAAGQPLPPAPKRPKRDRHGMHVVRGCAVLAGAGAAWLVRSRFRRFAAGVATVALVTGGTLSPDLMEQAPAAQVPAVHHHAVHHRHRDGAVVPPVIPARRKRRRSVHASSVSSGAPPRPSASPSPSQASPDPDPHPLPSVTVPPSPLPTCLDLTGHHCHDDGGIIRSVVGDATGVLRALAG